MTERTFRIGTGPGLICGAQTGDGPALLMLHGGPGTGDYMAMLHGETAGWRAVRYQQRGLAPSALDGPFTVAQHVADAVAVLDALGIAAAVVLGHSWGAHLALQLAVAHPGRVAGLVLVDGLGVASPDGGTAEFGQGLIRKTPDEMLARLAALAEADLTPDDAASEQLALLWPFYYADPRTAPAAPAGVRVSATVNTEGVASVAQSLAGGFAERLRDVTVPAVLVLGEQGPMPLATGREVAALLPGAQVVVIPEGGHLPWHERPGCVTAALTAVRARAAV